MLPIKIAESKLPMNRVAKKITDKIRFKGSELTSCERATLNGFITGNKYMHEIIGTINPTRNKSSLKFSAFRKCLKNTVNSEMINIIKYPSKIGDWQTLIIIQVIGVCEK